MLWNAFFENDVMCKSNPENQRWAPVGRRWKQGWPGTPGLLGYHLKATYLVGQRTYCEQHRKCHDA